MSNQGMSDYGDSSWPLYSMYSKITDDDDNKMVEYCQKDADGTLIFVSLYVSHYCAHQLRNVVGFILCHSRCIAYGHNTGPQAKLARHLRILPREHLSTSTFRRLKRFSFVDPICFGQTTCILSTKICHLGELTLVLELGCKPFRCHDGNDDEELGT